MERQDFKECIAELYGFFRLRVDPDAVVLDRWFDKVGFIPNEPMVWIIDRLEDRDSLPRNLPREIMQLWRLYLKSHPHKFMSEDADQCDECGGSGLLFYRKPIDIYEPPMMCDFVAICARCENSRKPFGRLLQDGGVVPDTGKRVDRVAHLTRQQIKHLGYELLPSGR